MDLSGIVSEIKKIETNLNLNHVNEMKRKLEELEDEMENSEQNNIEIKKRKVQILKEFSEQQPKQRTNEWFELRRQRITASDIASCLKKNFIVCEDYIKEFYLDSSFQKSDFRYCNPYADEKQFIIKKKGYTKYEDNPATRWGNKFENVATRFYENLKNKNVLEFGLILHPNVNWLACSPDGITDDGDMLEIKCPYRRNIDGVPPLYYWIQVQTQLEVCDLDSCDYLECQISNITEEEFDDIEDETTYIYNTKEGKKEEKQKLKCKGLLINFKKNDTYFYPPRKYKTYEEIKNWAEKKCKKYKKLKPEIEYYKIEAYSLVPIKRNASWFSKVKPMLQKTWNKVLNFKYEDYKDVIEKKSKKEDISLDLTSKTKILSDCLLLTDEEEQKK